MVPIVRLLLLEVRSSISLNYPSHVITCWPVDLLLCSPSIFEYFRLNAKNVLGTLVWMVSDMSWRNYLRFTWPWCICIASASGTEPSVGLLDLFPGCGTVRFSSRKPPASLFLVPVNSPTVGIVALNSSSFEQKYIFRCLLHWTRFHGRLSRALEFLFHRDCFFLFLLFCDYNAAHQNSSTSWAPISNALILDSGGSQRRVWFGIANIGSYIRSNSTFSSLLLSTCVFDVTAYCHHVTSVTAW